jgi:hypothetical protein
MPNFLFLFVVAKSTAAVPTLAQSGCATFLSSKSAWPSRWLYRGACWLPVDHLFPDVGVSGICAGPFDEAESSTLQKFGVGEIPLSLTLHLRTSSAIRQETQWQKCCTVYRAGFAKQTVPFLGASWHGSFMGFALQLFQYELEKQTALVSFSL